ncbi:MAG: hypothetical protein P8Y44_03270 [Acidobacteriota bacterium]|jgi:hypothetical protein
MTERHPVDGQSAKLPLDGELNMKGILLSTVGLVAITVVAALLMWGFMAMILNNLAGEDPPPPALEEARVPYLPPAPRLQTTPFRDLSELRAEENALLTSYGWVNQEAGIARIPIEQAMDLLVERGSARSFVTLQPGTEAAAEGSDGEQN